MVIVRRELEWFVDLKSLNLELDGLLPWYVFKSWGLVVF